jgi:radical SAM protein with 4Fe4S-binding SPASM domain
MCPPSSTKGTAAGAVCSTTNGTRRLLEPHFAKKYALEARRTVVTRRRPVIHPVYPELRVNIDREIMPAENGHDEGESGVLEIKSVGRGMFYKIKHEGLPVDYIAQLQHGIECMRTTWGAFAIGCRDNGELIHWDVQRDPDLIGHIVEESLKFWRQVQTNDIPARLEPDDRRCQKCEYRRSCQGNALIQLQVSDKGEVERDDRLVPLINELKERQALLIQAESLVDDTKAELKATLGDRQTVESGNSVVYYRPQKAKRGDFKQLAESYDDLRTKAMLLADDPKTLAKQFLPSDEYRKDSYSRPLRIF